MLRGLPESSSSDQVCETAPKKELAVSRAEPGVEVRMDPSHLRQVLWNLCDNAVKYASDAGGISEVRFLVDGAQVGSDTTAPYTFDWDTSTVADGQYALRAEAVDAAGNTAQSSDVTVTVSPLADGARRRAAGRSGRPPWGCP